MRGAEQMADMSEVLRTNSRSLTSRCGLGGAILAAMLALTACATGEHLNEADLAAEEETAAIADNAATIAAADRAAADDSQTGAQSANREAMLDTAVTTHAGAPISVVAECEYASTTYDLCNRDGVSIRSGSLERQCITQSALPAWAKEMLSGELQEQPGGGDVPCIWWYPPGPFEAGDGTLCLQLIQSDLAKCVDHGAEGRSYSSDEWPPITNDPLNSVIAWSRCCQSNPNRSLLIC